MHNTWHFVAMQYYGLILNRTYLVAVDESCIEGKVCRRLTAVEAGGGLTRYITGQLAVHGDLNDPYSYMSDQKLARPHNADFSLSHSEITGITYNPKKKWGMGPYPHDGRITISTVNGQRELIILGTQPGKEIAERISEVTQRANNSFKPPPQSGAA